MAFADMDRSYFRSTLNKQCTDAAAGGLPGCMATSSSGADDFTISLGQVDGHAAARTKGRSKQRQRFSQHQLISHLEELLAHCYAHLAELEAQQQVEAQRRMNTHLGLGMNLHPRQAA